VFYRQLCPNGKSYSPSATAGTSFRVVDTIVGEVVAELLFQEDVEFLECHFATRVLADDIGEHDGVAGVWLGRTAAFRLRNGGPMRTMATVAGVVR